MKNYGGKMESKIIKQKAFHLKLNEKEAEWLRGIMQNPMVSEINGNINEESEEDSKMRKLFFYALKEK